MIGVRLKRISKYFRVNGRRITVLDDLATTITPGETVSIVGYSGCGKTTLLRIIADLEKPDAGEAEFYYPEGVSPRKVRTGIVFQEPRLLPWLTVEKNMALALRHVGVGTDVKGEVDRVLNLIGIPDFRTAYPNQLSGGMAQRVALGRALCRRPDLLLMDEPFGALDALTRYKLHQELNVIFTDKDVTTVLVTHDVSEAVLLGNRVLVVKQGSIFREIPITLEYPRDASSPEFILLRDTVLDSILG